MDFFKEHKTQISYGVFGFSILCALVVFICTCILIPDVADLGDAIKNSGSSSYRDIYTNQIGIVVERFILSLLVIWSAGYGIKTVHDGNNFKMEVKSFAAIFICASVGLLTDAALAMAIFPKGYSSLIPGEIKGMLALGIIGAIIGIICEFIPEDYVVFIKITAAVSALCVFIAPCLSLALLSDSASLVGQSNGKEIAVQVFVMLGGLVGIFGGIALEQYSYVARYTPRYSRPSYTPRPTGTSYSTGSTYSRPTTNIQNTGGYSQPQPAPANPQVTPAPVPPQPHFAPKPTAVLEAEETENPMEKLRDLKKLFDDEIISKEEYDEARKKYVSKL